MTTEYRQALGGLETLAAKLRELEAARVEQLTERLPQCEQWVQSAESTVEGVETHLQAWWSQGQGLLWRERWVAVGGYPSPDLEVDRGRLDELMAAVPGVGERLGRAAQRWWQWMFPW